MGDWEKAPSGINCEKKLELLKGEGVEFDEKGILKDEKKLWEDFGEGLSFKDWLGGADPEK
jgi:methylated-DNA-[protein]-cysteine S-methyltransferase